MKSSLIFTITLVVGFAFSPLALQSPDTSAYDNSRNKALTVLVSPDGKQLVTNAMATQIWDARTCKLQHAFTLQVERNELHQPGQLPDGTTIEEAWQRVK